MGTTYNITVITENSEIDNKKLASTVELVLADVNAKMSNWVSSSEISKLNKLRTTDPIPISRELAYVMAQANEVHEKSGGKFDVTLGPLIELWGFGTRKPEDPIPSQAEITNALALVGQTKNLKLDKKTFTISKSRPEISTNLSAIAKGYGIDAVADRLIEIGFEDYLVEIGGDLRAAGKNQFGKPWRIGIEKPEIGSRQIKQIVALNDSGMATSGDYNNFTEVDGKRYSHIIDPSSGRPINHRTTSVTVVSSNATKADAWATALLVLGNEKGLKIADRNGIAAYFISHASDTQKGQYVINTSKAIESILKKGSQDIDE
ncbi:MAG: FAD:protein FMN transferase [Pseudomonadota bacterium]